MNKKLAVIAIGGNALIAEPDKMSVHNQAALVRDICSRIVDIISLGWRVVITHGNGPQVGMVMRRSEIASKEVPILSLDYAGADLQGGIGYMFAKALRNEFFTRHMKTEVAAMLTQVLVDSNDPAFANPTKPVGAWMDKDVAMNYAKELGWVVAEDSGRGWRRLVASPMPKKIVEISSINCLVSNDVALVACGGGGIPVIQQDDGKLKGIEAVIDKDFSSAILAQGLKASALILVTSVEKVALDFNTANERYIDSMTITQAQQACDSGQFAAGSMLPKVQALIEFVKHGGFGVITNIDNLKSALTGQGGTRIVT